MKTRAQYLTARGWMLSPEDGTWWDDNDGGEGMYTLDDAVTIQRARDAKEERAAWVAFAAAALPFACGIADRGDALMIGGAPASTVSAAIAAMASDMIDQYRNCFAAPARFDDEVA